MFLKVIAPFYAKIGNKRSRKKVILCFKKWYSTFFLSIIRRDLKISKKNTISLLKTQYHVIYSTFFLFKITLVHSHKFSEIGRKWSSWISFFFKNWELIFFGRCSIVILIEINENHETLTDVAGGICRKYESSSKFLNLES